MNRWKNKNYNLVDLTGEGSTMKKLYLPSDNVLSFEVQYEGA